MFFDDWSGSGRSRRARGTILGVGVVAALIVTSTAIPSHAEIQWRSGAISAPERMAPAEMATALSALTDDAGHRRIVIHFEGPVGLTERAELEASGVRLLSYLGGYAYFAALDRPLDATRLLAVPGTRALEAIDPANKLHPDLAQGVVHPWSIVAAPTPQRPFHEIAVYVLFHRDFDLSRSATVIEGFDGAVRSEMSSIHGVVAHLPADRIASLAGHDDVMYVEPPLPALTTLNDDNVVRTQADVVAAPPYTLDGSGVTVLVYDGGTVLSHPDLAGRLTIGPSDGGGVSDHATHVACTVAGDGGQFSGMAPGADVVSYTFEQAGGLTQGFLYTDPGDLQADYSEAASLFDVDLSNNSIGTNTAPNGYPCSWEGNYGVTSALIDEIVRGALGDPFRVVWANGNERGSGANCGASYNTTAPPACAKNHMTIGALNSNNDSVTGFTSWGPCDDGRLKPDVSAPGCQSDADGGVTSCSSSGGYTVKCGTSMASPTAAGVSALLLQQFRESFPARPDFRNAFLRALLAHTAVDIGNPGPDYKSGYGSIRTLPAVQTIQAERFYDGEVAQGQTVEFAMNGTFLSSVKVTLAWDDPAGTPDVNPALVNDLDLRVIGPDQTVYYPWTLDPANPGAPAVRMVRDGVNNIEQVLVPNPSVGTYRVQIVGFNVAEGPTQPLSVITSLVPEFCTDVPTFNGIVSATEGSSCGEIDLAWDAGQSNCDPAGSISYNVYRSTSQVFQPAPSNLVHFSVSSTSLTDQGLDPGATYYYIVRANDSVAGEDDNLIVRSSPSPIGPDNGAPLFEGLGSATAGGACGEIVLGWNAAVETCSGPVVYDIHRSTDPGFVPGPGNLLGTTFSIAFVDTAVTPGVPHSYAVRARDAAGNAELNGVRRNVTPTLFDVTRFETAFEPDDAGWSVVAPNDSTTGAWEWGDPQATPYQPEDDATVLGTNCWITGLATGPSNGDIDDGTTTLLSAAYDLTGAVNPFIEYERWFTNDQGNSPGDPTDTLRVDVSNDDGQNWTSLEVVGAGTQLEWEPVSLPFPLPATSQVRVRFTASDLGEGSLVEAGVDEFRLVDADQACLQCSQPAAGSICSISANRVGDDVRLDWSSQPSDTRAVVYDVHGCDPGDWVKLGSPDGAFFLHESAAVAGTAFNYRVTFVDACGVEQGFCGTNDCP